MHYKEKKLMTIENVYLEYSKNIGSIFTGAYLQNKNVSFFNV